MATRQLLLALLAASALSEPAGQSPAAAEEASTPSGLAIPRRECPEGDDCAAAPLVVPDVSPSWVREGAERLSADFTAELNANISRLNTSSRFLCYVAVLADLPNETTSSRDFARKTMKAWFGGNRSYDRTVLVLLLTAANRTEIVTGSRARKKLKDAQGRRIARKSNALLVEGKVEAAVRHAVKQVADTLKKEKGLLGNMRSMMMPIMIGCVLLFLYFKNQGATMGGHGGMGGGMGGMGGGMGMGMGMGGVPGMAGAGGFGGMAGGMTGMTGMGGLDDATGGGLDGGMGMGMGMGMGGMGVGGMGGMGMGGMGMGGMGADMGGMPMPRGGMGQMPGVEGMGGMVDDDEEYDDDSLEIPPGVPRGRSNLGLDGDPLYADGGGGGCSGDDDGGSGDERPVPPASSAGKKSISAELRARSAARTRSEE